MSGDIITILVVLVLYLAGLIGIGFYSKSKINSASGFLVATGQINLFMCICTIAALNIGSGVVVGGATNGANLGVWPGMYYSISIGVGCAVAGLFFAGKMRVDGCVVPLDYFEKRFGNQKLFRTLAWVANTPNLLGIFVVQLLACGSILSAFGIDRTTGIIACALVILIYSTMGGMLSVVLGDLLQLAILAIGIPMAAFYAVSEMTQKTGMGWGDIISTPFIPDLGNFVYNIVPFILGMAVSYDCFMRYQSSKDANTAKLGTIGGGIVTMIIGFFASVVGVAGHILYPEVNTDSIFAYTVEQTCPAIPAAIVIVAVIAAAMSSGNCLLIGMSGTITKDFYRSTLHPDKELDELPLANVLSRGTVVVGCLVGIVITFFASDIIGIIISSTMPYTSALLMPLICSVYYKNATLKGLKAGAVVGFICGVYLFFESTIGVLGLNTDWGQFTVYFIVLATIIFVSTIDKQGEKFPLVQPSAS